MDRDGIRVSVLDLCGKAERCCWGMRAIGHGQGEKRRMRKSACIAQMKLILGTGGRSLSGVSSRRSL